MKVISKSTKKQCILISLLLACVLCIVGLFGIFSKKEERISASATTTTDESKLYWETGAGIFTGDLGSKRIRFILHVHKDALNKGELVITLNDSGNENCFFDVYGFTGNVRNTANNILGGNNEYTTSITEKELRFNTDKLQSAFSGSDWVIIWAVAQSDLDTDISMTAKNSGYSAESDERNWIYIYNAWTSATGGTGNPWQESLKNFASSKNNTTAFEINDDYWLDSTNGLEMTVNVPKNYTDKIATGQQLVEEKTSESWGATYVSYRRYEEYFLSLHRKNDGAPDITSPIWYESTSVYTYTTVPYGLKNGTILEIYDGVRSGNMNGGRYYYMSLVKKITEYANATDVYTKTETISYQVVDSTNAIEVNVADKAWEIVYEYDLDLSASQREWLLDLAGTVPQTDEIQVNIKYKMLSDANNPASIVFKNDKNFFVKRVDIASKRLVTQTMYDLVEGISSLADFNVCYRGQYWQNGHVYNTGERIILQATGYAYTYDSVTQTGTLEVLYNEFQYKELALRVINNDLDSNLEMLCYTTDVTIDPATNYVTMRWDFAMIEETLYNACKWHFTLSDGNFRIRNKPSSLTSHYEKVNDIPTALVLEFPLGAENDLANTDIVVEAYIEPVVDCNVNYQYVRLSINDNGDIVEETVTSETFVVDSMTLKSYNSTNFMLDYGEIINGAIQLDEVENGAYCKATGVQRNRNADGEDGTPSYTFIVEYEYNALFKITNNKTSDVRYVALNNASLYYNGNAFVRSSDIPDGHRVEKLTTDSADLKITPDENNADDYTKTQVEVRTGVKQKKILPIHITYTDKWNLKVEYFETYQNTPFALKKVYNGEISVKDYPDIRNMTATDIHNATGVPVTVINIIKANENVTFDFDNVSTYTAVLEYGVASIVSTDYEGNRKEISVPLSRYEDWVAGMGNPDWTILMLNTAQNKYFKYSNEVERSKLYGLFSTAIFEEKVSDLNYYFRNNTGDGCMTIFEHTEATGSKAYKFFYKWTDKEVTNIPGRVGMFFCELTNDDNKMLHSYNFYLDGSTTESYISNGGADDRYDDDTAIENKGEDIKDKITGKAKGLWQNFKDSKWYKVVVVLLWVAGGLLVVGIAFKYGRRFLLWVTSDKQAVKRSDWTPTYAQKKNKSKSKSKSKNKSRRK